MFTGKTPEQWLEEAEQAGTLSASVKHAEQQLKSNWNNEGPEWVDDFWVARLQLAYEVMA